MGPHAPKDVHEISGYFGLSLGSDKTLGNRWATQGQYFRLFLGFMVTIFWATWLLHADTTLAIWELGYTGTVTVLRAITGLHADNTLGYLGLHRTVTWDIWILYYSIIQI